MEGRPAGCPARPSGRHDDARRASPPYPPTDVLGEGRGLGPSVVRRARSARERDASASGFASDGHRSGRHPSGHTGRISELGSPLRRADQIETESLLVLWRRAGPKVKVLDVGNLAIDDLDKERRIDAVHRSSRVEEL